MNTRILIADAYEMMRIGLRSVLEKEGGFEIVGEASDGPEIVRLASVLNPHVIIMDLAIPLLSGFEVARRIRRANGDVKIIGLSVDCDQLTVSEMFKSGASSYLLKSGASVELLAAIRAVQRGEAYMSSKVAEVVVTKFIRLSPEPSGGAFPKLTPKQRQVVQLVAEGKSSREIAEHLSISTKTVETHRAQIKDKLGTSRIAELTKYAIRAGLTSVEN